MIQKNLNINVMDDYLSNHANEAVSSKKGNKTRKSLFAGNSSVHQDRIEQKRLFAQKRAMRIIFSAFAKENAVNEELRSREQKFGADLDIYSKASNDLQEINANMETLKDKDQKEYQNMDLVRQEKSEEKENLAKHLIAENSIISATKIEQLKSGAMHDAIEQADEIMAEANVDIIRTLIKEVEDYLEEKAKEMEEQAEEQLEAQKARDELIEKLNKRKEEENDMTDLIKLLASEKKPLEINFQNQVMKLMVNMNMIEDDIKGMTIDTKLYDFMM